MIACAVPEDRTYNHCNGFHKLDFVRSFNGFCCPHVAWCSSSRGSFLVSSLPVLAESTIPNLLELQDGKEHPQQPTYFTSLSVLPFLHLFSSILYQCLLIDVVTNEGLCCYPVLTFPPLHYFLCHFELSSVRLHYCFLASEAVVLRCARTMRKGRNAYRAWLARCKFFFQ